jgi:hypothetical protein
MNSSKILIKTNLASFDLDDKGCVKKRYETREDANESCKQFRIKYGGVHRLYYCNKCEGFHITTKNTQEMEIINSRHERRIERVSNFWESKLRIDNKEIVNGKRPIKFTKVTPEEINKKRNQTYKYKY